MSFPDLESIRAACRDLPPPDAQAARAVRERQAQLTKPSGSLGRLESLAEWLAAWLTIFAAVVVLGARLGSGLLGVTVKQKAPAEVEPRRIVVMTLSDLSGERDSADLPAMHVLDHGFAHQVYLPPRRHRFRPNP